MIKLDKEFGGIKYSSMLERAKGKNYHEIIKAMPEGRTLSSNSFENALYFDAIKKGKKPEKTKEFMDIYKNDIWQLTATGLRVPKGNNPKKPDYIDKNGLKLYIRTWLELDEEKGPRLIPESGFVPCTKDLHEVIDFSTGLPIITTNEEKYKKYGNHLFYFFFDENPKIDNISGHKDIVVERGSGWLFDVVARWLSGDSG